MASDIIINKAEGDPKFKKQFLILLNGKHEFVELREFVEKQCNLENIGDEEILNAAKNILHNEKKNREENQVIDSGLYSDTPNKVDDLLNKLLLEDLQKEFVRTQTLKDDLLAGVTTELHDIKKSRNRMMNMFTVAFIIGVCMIGVAIISAFIPDFRDIKLIALFAGLGATNVVSSLIFGPAKEIQSMIIRSVQLFASFTALINDSETWNI